MAQSRYYAPFYLHPLVLSFIVLPVYTFLRGVSMFDDLWAIIRLVIELRWNNPTHTIEELAVDLFATVPCSYEIRLQLVNLVFELVEKVEETHSCRNW